MKLLLSAAVLVCVAAVAVTSPALSADRWRPSAVDFELAPKASAAAAGGAVRSRALRAPRRFNLVGLRWRGRSEPRIALRVRSRGGRWSRWAALDAHAEHRPDAGSGERSAAGASAPLWVGEADHVQYRLSRRVPGLRLHFVNVKGSGTAGERVRTAVSRTANAAVGSLAGLLGAGSAQAQDPQPAIVPRADWGASQCTPRSGPSHGSVKAAHIHHTVSLNDYSAEEAPGIVLGICRYHRNSNGWNDIGYNFLVDKYGVLYEGRAGGIDRPVVGAQAQGWNSQTTGISNIGDHSSLPQTPAAIAAMARLIRWKLPLHGVPTSGDVTLTSAGGASSRYPAGAQVTVPRILGHRDTNATACPGSALYNQLDELRAQAAGAAPGPTSGTFLSANLASSGTLYGGPVPFRGTLTTRVGEALAGEVVLVQVLKRGTWKSTRRVRTGPGGTFEAALKPNATERIRARFGGRAGLRASNSRPALLRVRALVKLARPPVRGARGARVPVRGSVLPARRRVYLVVQRRRSGRWRKVSSRAVMVKRGRFRASFVPKASGRFRFYVVAKADRYTDRGRSPLEPLSVGRNLGAAPARR